VFLYFTSIVISQLYMYVWYVFIKYQSTHQLINQSIIVHVFFHAGCGRRRPNLALVSTRRVRCGPSTAVGLLCVSVCVCLYDTVERTDLWPRYLLRWSSWVKVAGGKIAFFGLKVREWNWENQMRQHGRKADLNWKLQVTPAANCTVWPLWLLS